MINEQLPLITYHDRRRRFPRLAEFCRGNEVPNITSSW